jgi:hypothetical protein
MSRARPQRGPLASKRHPLPSRCAPAQLAHTAATDNRIKSRAAGVESWHPHTLRAGIGVPVIGAASRAEFLVAAFFLPSMGRAARTVSFNGRPCEGTRKGAPVLSRYANLARSATLHWREGRQVFDLLIGAIHG